MSTGRFVWHELMTTDPKAAIAFYSEVVGWKTEAFPEPMGPEPYTMWVASQGPLGGVLTLPEPAKQAGAPPHWMGNVSVDDLDRTVAKVKELGGSIHVAPMAIPHVGRFSVIAEPGGASLAVVQFDQEMQPHDVSKPGEISWNELYTTDAEAALAFYGALFGWRREADFDMGPMGKYLLFGKDGQQYGGMMKRPQEMPVSAWTYYVRVDDLDAAIARATAKGGKLVNGPMEVPGGDRVAQLTDPQGASFALHAGKK